MNRSFRPYDVRCSTRTAAGLASVTRLAWYKGAARAKADASRPEVHLKMLARTVDGRLEVKLAGAKNMLSRLSVSSRITFRSTTPASTTEVMIAEAPKVQEYSHGAPGRHGRNGGMNM